MKRTFTLSLIIAMALLPLQNSWGTALGDQAPPLSIAKWMKGEAVDLAAGKGENIYVVEFWATWCGPCRTTIPHLTEIQKKYKDQNVTVIGVSDEDAATIAPFVEKMGAEMDYTVAADQSRATYVAYMQAFGQGGIPHAFIVAKSGEIVWHGHPMSGLEQVLDKVIAGTYDITEAKMIAKAEALLPEFGQLLMTGADNDRANEIAEQLLEYGASSPDLLNRIAWVLLTEEKIKYKNDELAMRAAQLAYNATQGQDPSIVETYARGFYETGDLNEAIRYQRKALSLSDDPDRKARYQETLLRYEAEASN